MNILEIGVAKGKELGIQLGIEQGHLKTLAEQVESAMKNFNIDLRQACQGLGTTVEEYEDAKRQMVSWEEKEKESQEHPI